MRQWLGRDDATISVESPEIQDDSGNLKYALTLSTLLRLVSKLTSAMTIRVSRLCRHAYEYTSLVFTLVLRIWKDSFC